MKKRHKFNARPTVIDGISFASLAEGRRYGELKLLVAAEKIHDLKLQPRYVLQAKFRHDGKAVREIVYVADFAYREDGLAVVEDVKGMETPVFKLKRKMFLRQYPELTLRITK